MFETKKDHNETGMRTLIELVYGSIAMKEQALSSKIVLWVSLKMLCMLGVAILNKWCNGKVWSFISYYNI